MPRKYDDEFRAQAVRLVTDHAGEYDTRTACVTAVAKRLGVSYESLRRWTNHAEIDGEVRDGVPTDTLRELRELKRKNCELEETIEIPVARSRSGRRFAMSTCRCTASRCVWPGANTVSSAGARIVRVAAGQAATIASRPRTVY
ncbi:transposase [Mycolicibacter icosiumassiliensis]|uniref:transposase n=1 Tax=Mycolicibacter icosiumassiliensis TaxID=1792835 RepID=UPI000A4A0923